MALIFEEYTSFLQVYGERNMATLLTMLRRSRRVVSEVAAALARGCWRKGLSSYRLLAQWGKLIKRRAIQTVVNGA